MFYIGMLFFSLAIASGLWGFAGIGVEVDSVARMIFYVSLLAASVTFAACLVRTAARGGADASSDETRNAALADSAAAATAGLRTADGPAVSDGRAEAMARAPWHAPSGLSESWRGGEPVPAPRTGAANGSIGQEV